MLSQPFKGVKTVYRLYILWHAWLASHIFLKTTQIMARAELPAGIGTTCFVFVFYLRNHWFWGAPLLNGSLRKTRLHVVHFWYSINSKTGLHSQMLTGDKGVQMHLWIHIIQYSLSSHDQSKRVRRHPSLVTWAFSLVGVDQLVFYTRIVRHSLLGYPDGSTLAIWPTNAKLSSNLSLQLALDSCSVKAGDWSRGLPRAEESEARRFPFSASTSVETDYIGCGVQYLRLPRRECRDTMVRKPNFPCHFSTPGSGGSGKPPETCPVRASALVTGGKSHCTVGGIPEHRGQYVEDTQTLPWLALNKISFKSFLPLIIISPSIGEALEIC